MSKESKERIVADINAVLKLDIDWGKLKRADLEKLQQFLKDPRNLIRIGVERLKLDIRRDYLEKPLRALIDEIDKRPLVSLSPQKSGPLGLGLLHRKGGLAERLRSRTH